MYEWILMTYYEIREALLEGGLWNLIRKRIYWQRTATPVEMDLTTLSPFEDIEDSDYQFIELTSERLCTVNWTFKVASRYFKACRNLKKGWRCLALANDSIVLGDIWCISQCKVGNTHIHTDLSLLGITCKVHEAYAFDMYIDTAYRGKNLAVFLQRFLQSTLKTEGYEKVYGFYWTDNVPALWMHRMLKFKELPKQRLSRFFFLQRAQPLR
jgi:GNAT superfamily N-acetyltransferase